jgi:hypothetical protein
MFRGEPAMWQPANSASKSWCQFEAEVYFQATTVSY